MSDGEELLYFDTFAHGTTEVSKLSVQQLATEGSFDCKINRMIVVSGIKLGFGSVSKTSVHKSITGGPFRS